MHRASGKSEGVEPVADEIGGHGGREASDIVPAEHLGAAPRRQVQRPLGAQRSRAPCHPLQEHGLPRFRQHVRAVVGGRAIDPEADPRAGLFKQEHGRDARPQPHVRSGAMGHAGARTSQARNLIWRRVDHVRVPHIRPNPTKLFGEFDRSPAKLLRAVGRFVPRFSQVSMRMRSIRARELHTLSHERRRHGKWGARSQDNADHGIAAVVMIRLDDAPGVAENCGLIFNQRVRRQAPLRLAQGHRAPSRVKAESHLGSSLDFVVDAGAVGPDVCVIAGRCATRKHQLGYRDLAARVDGLRRQPGPDGIVCPEPPEQIRILRRGETACQSLGKMVVRIDHARHDQHAARVDDLVGLRRQRAGRPELLYHVLDYINAAVFPAAARIVHRDEQRCVPHQKGSHRPAPSRRPPRILIS